MSKLSFICVVYVAAISFGALTPIPIAVTTALCALTCSLFVHRPALKISLLSIVAGVGVSACHKPPPSPWRPETDCLRQFTGVVATIPSARDGHTRFTLKLTHLSSCAVSSQKPHPIPFRENAYITVKTAKSSKPVSFSPGDTISFAAFAQLNRSYAKSRESVRSPNTFLKGFVPDACQIAVIDTPNAFHRWIQRERQKIASFFSHHLSPQTAGIAIALTIGERTHLKTDRKNQFQRTGIAHLLAVSGLHLGIWALFSYGVLRFFLVRIYPLAAATDPSRYCAALTIPIIVLYVFLSGAHPPVIRAAVMYLAILVAGIVRMQSTPFQTLLLAAALILSTDPTLIANAGFQLSFISVAGFLYFLKRRDESLPISVATPYVEQTGVASPLMRILHRLRDSLFAVTRVSFLATLITSPFLAVHFQRVPLLAPAINVICVPLVTIVLMPLLMLTTAAILIFPPAAALTAPLCDTAIRWFICLISTIDPMAFVFFTPTTLLQAGVTLTSTALLCIIGKKISSKKIRWALFIATGAGGVLCYYQSVNITTVPDDALIFDFLDMGQGDATVVTFPNGEHWLIDGGGTAQRDIGRDHLVPSLQSLGISTLDKVILTHPDPDHLMGIPAVLQQISVRELWDNGQGLDEPTHPAYSEMRKIAHRKKIPIKRGGSICGPHQVGRVLVTVLHPCFSHRTYAPELSFNDNSIVLHFQYHRHTVLLPGDLSFEGEQHLLKSTSNLSAAVLKLGHHGSGGATSIAFLQAVQPKHAVASCGFHNRFHFPSTSLRNRLKSRRISLHRTDMEGWIRYILTPFNARFENQKN
ncbi:MAG: DNA internalization-related competence protein ComEC/Rec2 [Deltaproteobacteria bacterium]|nr:DNA internalization-related competence protein ComEC/Rec2 [Deltaproteobacteria bacterium]MBN2672276.1 DNA internalization-related competence protein ComEC/Rec2 [Deltaproteobacteria bacterium]